MKKYILLRPTFGGKYLVDIDLLGLCVMPADNRYTTVNLTGREPIHVWDTPEEIQNLINEEQKK